MWILRFHRLEPRDYNTIARLLKKSGFSPRSIAPIVFAKALIYKKIQKKSWRKIAELFGVSHIALYKFYEHFSQTLEFEKIFHVFLERRIIVYVGEKRYFSQDDLDNSQELYDLTRERLASMLKN